MNKIITNNEKETKDWAREYAQSFQGGEIIALNGDLGAGKTTFSQGIALGLGVKQNVNSPTFVIMKIYDTNHPKIKKLVHIDAYRLESEKDLETIGAHEYFEREDVVVLIEWAEKIKQLLTKFSKCVRIINIDNKLINKRNITIWE